MTELVAGIDYDSEAIYAVTINADTGDYVDRLKADLTSGGGDAIARARRVREVLPARTRWQDEGVVAIGIEMPYTRQINSLVAQIRIQGAIIACLPRGVELIPLTPNRLAANHGWKALTVGTTTASKPEIRAWAHAHGMPQGLEQDFSDAFCIAHAALIVTETVRAAAA